MINRWKVLLLVLVLITGSLALPAGIAAAPDVSDYKILGSIGGPSSAVAVSGNYVYVGKGASIIVLENTGGSLRQKGNQLGFPSYVSDVKIQGKTLYVAAGSGGLHIVDVSDPLKPIKKGSYNTLGFVEAVEVKGTTAYLANGIEGLQIVDVTNPKKPAALGQAYKGKHAFGIAVSGNNAYIAAADDGLLVADISQSRLPREIASYDTPGVARNVAVSGKYAYVADDWKGVSVVNISNPSAPALAKAISTAGRAHGVALDKNYLYVADSYMGLRIFDVGNTAVPKDINSFIPAGSQMTRVAVKNETLFCVDRANGVMCFNASKPSELKLKGFYSHTVPVPLYLPAELAEYKYGKEIARLMTLGIVEGDDDGAMELDDEITRGELAFFICSALRADKAAAVKKTKFTDVPSSYWEYGYIQRVAQLGIMSGDGKGHFSPDDVVTNTEAIATLLRMTNRLTDAGAGTSKVMAAGKKLGLTIFVEEDAGEYIGKGSFYAMLEKAVNEISDGKTGLTLLQSKFGIERQAFPMEGIQTAVKGKYAYVTCGTGGFSILDVQDPGSPKQVAHLDLPEMVSLIRIYGNYAYLMSYYSIHVVDISNPEHPVRVYNTDIPEGGPIRGVDIDSNRMYMADEYGFSVLSLSDPAKPVLLKHSIISENIFGHRSVSSDIAARDGIIYVAMELKGLEIYDVSDLNKIKLVNTYKGDGNHFAANIQFHGKYAFDIYNSSMDILDITDIRKPGFVAAIEDTEVSQYCFKAGMLGNLLIMPNDSKGILITDISKPKSLKRTQTIDTMGVVTNVFVDGNRIYISDNLGGISVIGRTEGAGSDRNGSQAKSVSAHSVACNYNTGLFKGFAAEKYVMETGRVLTALNNRKKTFSQTLTVTNTENSGEGSLRWCLENIRENGRILFDPEIFDPLNPATIYATQGFGFRSDNIMLDASNAGVIIDGSRITDKIEGFYINTDNNVIKGLKIQNFNQGLIDITGKGNIIGGSRQKGRGPSGEGNVLISGGGFFIQGVNATDNIVVGNNIGVDTDGKTPAGTEYGIQIGYRASRNVVGLDLTEYRNIVGDNHDRGIMIREGSFGNLIEGNYVGTDISGTKALANYEHGIASELGGYGNIIRNNVSCSNGGNGLLIWDGGGSYNVVVGNCIGIGADHATLLPNLMPQVDSGGGVGGASFYNIFGGMDMSLKNDFSSGDEAEFEIRPRMGIYDTIVNGKVYKYADNVRY